MDKNNFKETISEIHKRLVPILADYGIAPKPLKFSNIISTDTNGWCIELKYLSKIKCYLELWYDKWTLYEERKLWYGFFSTNDMVIKKISKISDTKPFIITDKDFSKNSKNQYQHLSKKLFRKKFEIPVFEMYHSSKHYYYGIYEFTSIKLSLREKNKLFERIIGFYNSVFQNITEFKKYSVPEDYAAVENRKKVVSHIRRERNAFLSTLRKQKDNYQCQICDTKLENIYGNLGKNYAEAHHIIPLKKLTSSTKSNIDDLITVCPNCHRMLHKMQGVKADINKLKKIIKIHNRI